MGNKLEHQSEKNQQKTKNKTTQTNKNENKSKILDDQHYEQVSHTESVPQRVVSAVVTSECLSPCDTRHISTVLMAPAALKVHPLTVHQSMVILQGPLAL